MLYNERDVTEWPARMRLFWTDHLMLGRPSGAVKVKGQVEQSGGEEQVVARLNVSDRIPEDSAKRAVRFMRTRRNPR